MAPTSYSDVLARNLRAARSRLDINQEALAARMRSLGYSAWLRQTVANVEKARRRVTAEEIFGLAYALETSIGALMQATNDDLLVAFPGGGAVAAVSVQRSAAGRNDGAVLWDDGAPSFPEPLTELGRKLGVNPAIRALAAMAEVVEAEREREAAMESGQR